MHSAPSGPSADRLRLQQSRPLRPTNVPGRQTPGKSFFQVTSARQRSATMYTRILMSASATLLIGMGLILSFAPAEAAARLEMSGGPPALVTLQVMSGLFMGLGVINWMWRGNLIGGIYGRPI